MRTGQFRNTNWEDPTQSLHFGVWGLILCGACIVAGVGLWNLKPWSRWIETLLFAPKLYCVYALFLYPYVITRSWLFLGIMLAVIGDAGFVTLLWYPSVRATLRATPYRPDVFYKS